MQLTFTIGKLVRGRHPAPAATAVRRMVVTVTVLGSTGPIRFVAGDQDPVAAVIGTALRRYAREGRLPALGCDVGKFHLFCARSDYMEPLDPVDAIGARGGGREFTLCKKEIEQAAFRVPWMATSGTCMPHAHTYTQMQPHTAGRKKQGGAWRRRWCRGLEGAGLTRLFPSKSHRTDAASH
ncbi:hypothetical protein Taro_032720 [Colocasia esculenta]|uniref:DUF7054 domain-containing protein n=1 Tax=Colocasia esculenta TaxID=4460 RepID=A0A843VTD0_COLES|nr:hypothetical protein [Colocasia esculenta]